VLLYELATGARPFQAATTAALTDEILNAAPPPPGRFQPRLSRELERIVLKCLEKNREDRYQSAREIAIDLRRLLSPSSGAARPASVRPARTPGRLLAWSAGVMAVLLAGGTAAFLLHGGHRLDSVVVLPFANATGNHDLDYLGDGVAEELINHLTQVAGVKVIARATAFAYRDKQASPRQIAAELGVKALVSGRISARGDLLSVQVDVVDTSDASQVWGGKIERPLDQIKAAQQEIAGDVTAALRLELTSQQEQQAVRRQTDNPAAYQLYLRGRQDLSEIASPATFRRSIEMFKRATAADPAYALAWSGLADAYSYLAIMDIDAPERVMPLAREAALTSFRLDPGLAEAHNSIGIVKFCYDRDFEGAESAFRQAVAISPGDTFARHWLAHNLEITGRLPQAHEEMRRIFELDPLSPIYITDLALEYYYMRRPEEVVQMSQTWAASTEGSVYPWLVLAKAQQQMGQRDRNLATIEQVCRRDDSPYMRGWAAWLFARLGRPERTRATIEDLQARALREYVPSYALALAFLGLGERDQALRHLDAAERERSVPILFEIGLHPAFDALRDDPRYRDLLRRLNLQGASPSRR
jgi:TolB-like protein